MQGGVEAVFFWFSAASDGLLRAVPHASGTGKLTRANKNSKQTGRTALMEWQATFECKRTHHRGTESTEE